MGKPGAICTWEKQPALSPRSWHGAGFLLSSPRHPPCHCWHLPACSTVCRQQISSRPPLALFCPHLLFFCSLSGQHTPVPPASDERRGEREGHQLNTIEPLWSSLLPQTRESAHSLVREMFFTHNDVENICRLRLWDLKGISISKGIPTWACKKV